jgi:hypothetical protein
MSAFNNFLQQALRDLFKNGTAISTSPTYLGISTQDPSDTGSLTGEPTGAWYSRQLIDTTAGATPNWTSATGAATGIENAQGVAFSTATTTPGQISHFFLIDETTGAATQNMLMHTSATNPRSIATGDQPRFGAGQITFTFD